MPAANKDPEEKCRDTEDKPLLKKGWEGLTPGEGDAVYQSTQKKMDEAPKLMCDLLNELVRKVVVTPIKSERGESVKTRALRTVHPITQLLFVSDACKNAVLRQFGKMSGICLDACSTGECLVANFSMDSPYLRNSEKTSEENASLLPFRVGGAQWFIAYLIEYGKLRVKQVHFHSGMFDWIGENGMEVWDRMRNMRVVEVLSNLLGIEDEDPGASQRQEVDLQLDGVRVDHYDAGGSLNGLDRFIALNAKELDIQMEVWEKCGKTRKWSERPRNKKHRIRSLRTQVLRIGAECSVDTFHPAEWRTLLHYLVEACPNLQEFSIFVEFGDEPQPVMWDLFYDPQPWGVAEGLMRAVTAISDAIFPGLMEAMGATSASVLFEFRVSLRMEDVMQLQDDEHPLLDLGEPDQDTDGYLISRSIDVQRGECLKPWRISFRVDES